MNIISVDANTWRIEEERVRFFLLAGNRRAMLLDSGLEIHNAKDIAEGLVSLPVELLNTHCDLDHIGSNAQFETFYMHPSEASNYYNTQNRTGRFCPVEDGEVLDLGNRELEIIHLPGHTPGSIAVLDVKNRVLYGGDIIQDGDIFMFGVQRELRSFIWSLGKLERYRDRFDTIHSPHGTFQLGPDMICAIRDGAVRVLAGQVAGTDIHYKNKPLKRYDVGCAAFLCENYIGAFAQEESSAKR